MLHTVGQEECRYRGEKSADQQHHACPGPVALQANQPVAGIVHAYMCGHNKKKQRKRPDQHTADQKFGTDRHEDMPLQREIYIVHLKRPVSEFLNQRNNRRAGQIELNQCMHAGNKNRPNDRHQQIKIRNAEQSAADHP
ncbi:hypothetical protein D3C75_564050 [compost metagenome]